MTQPAGRIKLPFPYIEMSVGTQTNAQNRIHIKWKKKFYLLSKSSGSPMFTQCTYTMMPPQHSLIWTYCIYINTDFMYLYLCRVAEVTWCIAQVRMQVPPAPYAPHYLAIVTWDQTPLFKSSLAPLRCVQWVCGWATEGKKLATPVNAGWGERGRERAGWGVQC